MEKELTSREIEIKEIKGKYEVIFGEHSDMKMQIKILNENLRRESELCMSRDKENITLNGENKTLKELLGEMKD